MPRIPYPPDFTVSINHLPLWRSTTGLRSKSSMHELFMAHGVNFIPRRSEDVRRGQCRVNACLSCLSCLPCLPCRLVFCLFAFWPWLPPACLVRGVQPVPILSSSVVIVVHHRYYNNTTTITFNHQYGQRPCLLQSEPVFLLERLKTSITWKDRSPKKDMDRCNATTTLTTAPSPTPAGRGTPIVSPALR